MTHTQRDPGERLNSWKEIAVYLNRSVRTVIRWEDEQGLPVHRQVHDKRGAVHAYKTELDAWVQQRTLSPESADRAPGPDARPKPRWFIWASAGAILAAVFASLVLSVPSSSPPPQTRPLTTYPGSEVYRPVAGRRPRGLRLGPRKPGSFDLYEKQIGSDAPPVRPPPSRRAHLSAWSPDGLRAFARALGDGKYELAWIPASAAGTAR
jgi:hypothetical protein